jgi:hypothetical protein
MSLYVLNGDRRTPSRSGPIAFATAAASSTAKRLRFSIEPPYASVRLFDPGSKNCSIR